MINNKTYKYSRNSKAKTNNSNNKDRKANLKIRYNKQNK